MKIAFLFHKYPSLTETFLAREVEALRKLGLEIEIFALEAGQGARKIERPLLTVIYRMSAPKFHQMLGRHFARQIAGEGFTHIHATWANHVADLAMGAAQTLDLSWSFAAHAHDLWVSGGAWKSKLKSAQFAFVCTRAGETQLRKFGDNVLYAPHGLPLQNYPFRIWRNESELRLLGVGRLVEKKGWPILVEARQFLPRHAKLNIIGEGPLRNQLPAEILLGALSHGEVVEQMQRANCLVLPSIQTREGDRDGLANVILEAAALGLPIVTTNQGSAGDFVDETTGWICQKPTAASLASAISQVFADETETRQRCQNARERVESLFDSEKNARVLARAFAGSIRD